MLRPIETFGVCDGLRSLMRIYVERTRDLRSFSPITLGGRGDLESLTPRLEGLVASRLSCELVGGQARIFSGLSALLMESVLWYVMPSTPFVKELHCRATGKRLSPRGVLLTRDKAQRPGGRLLT